MTIPIMPEEDYFNRGFDLDEMIDNLPAGLERAILRVLEFHQGRINYISGDDLVTQVRLMGFPSIENREVRACISQLRESGVPGTEICSTGGIEGGYWMAADHEEAEEFVQREFDSRAKALHKQASAIRAAAEKHWGKYSPEKQVPLFSLNLGG